MIVFPAGQQHSSSGPGFEELFAPFAARWSQWGGFTILAVSLPLPWRHLSLFGDRTRFPCLAPEPCGPGVRC